MNWRAMTNVPVRAVVVAAVLVGVSVAAIAMKPSDRLGDHGPRIDFEGGIPQRFGDWRLDPTVEPIQAPDVQDKLDRLYDQVISRTYYNSRGQRMMLSIAYGANQLGEANQVHRPEYCYAAQGFEIVASQASSIGGPRGDIDVMRLVAVQGIRQEPITYWLTIGDKTALPGITRRMTQWEYALRGEIPDGAVVRISSIGPDWNHEFQLQRQFIDALFGAVTPEIRAKIAAGHA